MDMIVDVLIIYL